MIFALLLPSFAITHWAQGFILRAPAIGEGLEALQSGLSLYGLTATNFICSHERCHYNVLLNFLVNKAL